MNRLLFTVRKARHSLALDQRSTLIHHTMENGWGMADRGNRLAGIVEGFDQSDGIGVIDQIPHWPVAAHVEYGVEIFRLHIREFDRVGKRFLRLRVLLEP